jgi:ADP-ribosylglycohydrolase
MRDCLYRRILAAFVTFICVALIGQAQTAKTKSTASADAEMIGRLFLSPKTIRTVCLNRIGVMTRQGYETKGLKEKLQSLPESYDALLGFALELTKTPLRVDFSYVEPFDLAAIQAARPSAGRKDTMPLTRSDVELRDRIAGGVYGQFIGLVLGKPLEMSWTLPIIRTYLEGAKAWPLDDFVPPYSPSQVRPLRRDTFDCTKGFVWGVPEDDDLNYFVANLKTMEGYGRDFSTRNIADTWNENIPYDWAWGPEHSRLFLIAGLRLDDHGAALPEDKDWEKFVGFLNDGEELIGAMIRGEVFGLACPGNPARAAELAWRDGRLTHAKTGLYAEMWLAATVAAAFSTRNPVEAIQAGIDQIPVNSRYAECLNEALRISLEEKDWLKAWERIDKKWGALGHAGTMNESAAMINALVHSADPIDAIDYGKAITMTVMQGWDADCSGAMTGSIAGVLAGFAKIPDRWRAPLNDAFHCGLATERDTKISRLADRVYQATKIINR